MEYTTAGFQPTLSTSLVVVQLEANSWLELQPNSVARVQRIGAIPTRLSCCQSWGLNPCD